MVSKKIPDIAYLAFLFLQFSVQIRANRNILGHVLPFGLFKKRHARMSIKGTSSLQPPSKQTFRTLNRRIPIKTAFRTTYPYKAAQTGPTYLSNTSPPSLSISVALRGPPL
jgi:hypothetical protein